MTDTTKRCSPFYRVPDFPSFNLFRVYAHSYNGELYHTIDDQLKLMQDYGVTPRFMTKDDVITCFNHIAETRNDNSKIKTANYLKYLLLRVYSVVMKPSSSASVEWQSLSIRTPLSPKQTTLLETKSLPSSSHGTLGMKESSLSTEKSGDNNCSENCSDVLFLLNQIDEVTRSLIVIDDWPYTLSFVLSPQLHP